MTIDEIVSAIRALPVPERLHLIERIARETADEFPSLCTPQRACPPGVTLTERHGMLLVESDETLPIDAFDHRVDRDARADQIWSAA